MTETFYGPTRILTLTLVIPSETSPLIPLSTQTTISGPESSGSGTLVSSGGTVPNTTPTPSPSPSGTSASSSASISIHNALLSTLDVSPYPMSVHYIVTAVPLCIASISDSVVWGSHPRMAKVEKWNLCRALYLYRSQVGRLMTTMI